MMLFPFVVVFVTNIFALAFASPSSGENATSRPDNHAAAAKAFAIGNMTKSDQMATREELINDALYAGVDLCSETDWRGACYWQAAPGGKCHTWPADWTRASSFGPGKNIWCAIYEQSNCKGNRNQWSGNYVYQGTDISHPFYHGGRAASNADGVSRVCVVKGRISHRSGEQPTQASLSYWIKHMPSRSILHLDFLGD